MEQPQLIDPLDRVADDPMFVIALMLWQNRMRHPDLYAKIEPNDIKGFEDCVQFLKVNWQVRIERPAEIPAQEAIPAHGNRRAVPARPAIPPRPYVIVNLVDERTGDAIKPIENNQADYDVAQQAAAVRKAKDNAPMLAGSLMEQARSGNFSLSEMTDAANALLTLAGAV